MIEHSIKLSTKDFKDTNTYFKIKQNDIGTHIFVFEYDNDFDYAIIKFKRPDKSIVISQKLYKDGCLIKYMVADEVLILDGVVIGEISFYTNNSRISTNCFKFTVLKEINADDAISDDERLSVLNDLIINLINNKKEIALYYRNFADNKFEISNSKAYITMYHNTVKNIDSSDINGIFVNSFVLESNNIDINDEKYLQMHTSELIFSTGNEPFTFESNENIIFSGLDCENKEFNPLPKTHYIITFYYDTNNILAFVGGYDLD